VVSRVLLLASVVCCGLVVISFALFAYDQISGADKRQLAELTGQTAAASQSPHGLDRHQPRKFIDGAAHTLTSPFRSLFTGDNVWAVWLSSTVLALLVYGIGLGFLSRMARV
jgi:hypothetical protein